MYESMSKTLQKDFVILQMKMKLMSISIYQTIQFNRFRKKTVLLLPHSISSTDRVLFERPFPNLSTTLPSGPMHCIFIMSLRLLRHSLSALTSHGLTDA